jgi:hypothetical protein
LGKRAATYRAALDRAIDEEEKGEVDDDAETKEGKTPRDEL